MKNAILALCGVALAIIALLYFILGTGTRHGASTSLTRDPALHADEPTSLAQREALLEKGSLERKIITCIRESLSVMKRKGPVWDGYEELDMGSRWLAGELSRLYEEAAFLREWQGTPPPGLRRMFAPGAAPEPLDPALVRRYDRAPGIGTYDEWFVLLLNMQPRSLPAPFVSTILAAPDFKGLNLTHQMLAYFLIERTWTGVPLPTGFDGWRDNAALRTAREAGEGLPFTDLNAERFAFLIASGYFGLVRPGWITVLLESRGSNGCWRDAGDTYDNPHTSFLALRALAGYQLHLARSR